PWNPEQFGEWFDCMSKEIASLGIDISGAPMGSRPPSPPTPPISAPPPTAIVPMSLVEKAMEMEAAAHPEELGIVRSEDLTPQETETERLRMKGAEAREDFRRHYVR